MATCEYRASRGTFIGLDKKTIKVHSGNPGCELTLRPCPFPDYSSSDCPIPKERGVKPYDPKDTDGPSLQF